MKFLHTSRRKDLFLALPPETQAQLMEKLAAFMHKYLKAGKCMAAYMHDDMAGGVTIWEVESAEEVARLVLENPVSPFFDTESSLIVEWDAGMKLLREALRKAAAKK